MRRLPVYLLLDTSGSMHGEPIEAVKNGVQTLLTTLKQDPYALETAYVSVITFDSSARQAVPLTDRPGPVGCRHAGDHNAEFPAAFDQLP